MTFWVRKWVARISLARMLAWEPEKVIIAHGRPYEEEGTGELQRRRNPRFRLLNRPVASNAGHDLRAAWLSATGGGDAPGSPPHHKHA